jgi:hypothetical protein
MENAARQTLDHPMTFGILGVELQLFEGRALRDLANFRKRYRDNLVSRFKEFLEIGNNGSKFDIWISCASYTYNSHGQQGPLFSRSKLPMSNTNWLAKLYQKHLDELQEAFSKPLLNPRNIREEYLSALQAHIDSDSNGCVTCTEVHMKNGETFCKDLEDRLTQALNEVRICLIF